jgi:hypothetical protein
MAWINPMVKSRCPTPALVRAGALLVCLVAPGLAVSAPLAEDDIYTTGIDATLAVDAPGVLANDDPAGGGPLTAELVDLPIEGGFVELFADGSFEYTPPAGFTGEDVFTYRASDGVVVSNVATVTIEVTGTPGLTVYVNYAEFIAAVDALGLARVRESFEDDAAWGDVRTTVVGGEMTAPSITNLGLTWRANNPDGEVTTGDGPAFIGQWGFFTLPHGSYLTGVDCHLPVNCGDGWRVTSDQPLYALGGWVETNTPPAKLGLYLGPGLGNPVDLGETCDPDGNNCSDNAILSTRHQFYGLIVPDGVTEFEFRELEGTSGDAKYIFADEFAFGRAPDLDSDGDGVVDSQDNCTLVPNADQRNTDGDRYGNICDPDFDDNEFVGRADFAYFRSMLQTADPDADLNDDGIVNFGDFQIMRPYFGGPPGPSGL